MAIKDDVPGGNSIDSAILNSINVNIAVLNSTGIIIGVNEAWMRFGLLNGASAEVQRGVGLNYLEICQTASGEHAQEAKAAQQGIQSILNQTRDSFSLEYPCHSPDQKRWFLLTASPLLSVSNSAVVLHIDISERKLLENAHIVEVNKTLREKFRVLTARLAEAEELERRRLAQELHDQVGQNLTALGINLNVIRRLIPQKRGLKSLRLIDDSLELIEESVEQTRDIMAELRPPVLEDYGLLAALKWYAGRFTQRTELNILVEGDDALPKLPVHVESALFHICQEALMNVTKHAHAQKIKVFLGYEGDLVRLTIEDDGVGYDPVEVNQPGSEPTWGLLSIHERTEAIGGQVFVNSSQERGTKITIEARL